MFSKFFKKQHKKPSRKDIMAELKKNSAQARDAIGEENLQKLAAQISGKKPDVKIESSPTQRAKDLLKTMDNERLADNIRATYREDK